MSTELLKRADFLPRHAEARRLRPGILTDQPTEEHEEHGEAVRPSEGASTAPSELNRIGLVLLEDCEACGVDARELAGDLVVELRLDVIDPHGQVGGKLVDLAAEELGRQVPRDGGQV